jgi:CubicO group peptidase (beta-lactamase class C family)
MSRSVVFCLALMTLPLSALAQDAALSDAEVVARVEQVIERMIKRPEAVALSVAVARGDRILVEQGIGVADLEFDVPANAQTIFRIGSITKQFTAAGILKLVERGTLGLDDALTKHVPGFDTGGRTVTIRQLLNHTSGVPSYTSRPSFFPEGSPRDLTHEQLLAFVKGVPFDFEPDKGWNYSNTGYYLLGMVIEAADGRPYARFVQEELFTPLGLTRTRYGSEREIVKNRAQGYGLEKATGQRVNDALISMNTPGAAGALSSTAGDLLRWQIALVNGHAVSAASFRQMITSTVPTGQGSRRYGFGLILEEANGRKVVSHNGGINGFNSVLSWFPDQNLHVAVISSSETLPSNAVSNQIVAAITSSAPPPERTTQQPGSEAALRRLIDEIVRGEPDYSRMGPQLAEGTRLQLPAMKAKLAALGPVQSVSFAGVGLEGADTYDVRFANGALLRFAILLDAQGLTTLAGIRPAPPGR